MEQTLLSWKSTLGAKGLNVSVNKTILTFVEKCQKVLVGHFIYQCGACRNSVGRGRGQVIFGVNFLDILENYYSLSVPGQW